MPPKQAIAREPPKLPSSLSSSCRDLLGKLLNKQAACRMTIEDVRKHPWVRAGGGAAAPKLVGPPASSFGGAAAPSGGPPPRVLASGACIGPPQAHCRPGDAFTLELQRGGACNSSVRSSAGYHPAMSSAFLNERAQLARAHQELLSSHRPPSMCGADAAIPAFRSSLAGLVDPAARPPRPAALSAARPASAAPFIPPSPRVPGEGWRGPAPHSPRLGARGQPLSARG